MSELEGSPGGTLGGIKEKLHGRAQAEAARYAGGEDRPLGGYLAAMGTYTTLVAAGAVVARLTRRPLPERVGPWDVTLVAAATHRLSRLITKDPVTSPLRAPFTTYEGVSGPSELAEQVRGEGVRHAVGELVTCPFCAGLWAATGLVGGLVFFPRATRLTAATLASVAAADFLQVGFSLLREKSSR